MTVQDVEDVCGAARFGDFQIGGMEDEGVGLFAADAAVAADEFFEGGDGAVGVERADDPEVAGVGEVHDTLHLPDAFFDGGGAVAAVRGVGGDGVFADDFAGVEVARAVLADGEDGVVVVVAEDEADAFVCDEAVDHAGKGCV